MKKIILVESDPHHIKLYRRIFQDTAFDVELARTKDEMLEELRDIRNGDAPAPDMVILDLMLADGSGAEVLKAIKKNFLTSSIPVFAVTNYQNHDFEQAAVRNGIAPDKYLIKAHHTPAELVDILERYFGQKPPRPNRPQTTLS